MNNRSREVEALFQRMAAAPSGSRNPAVEQDAAHAAAEWPLLALLTPGLPARAPAAKQPAPIHVEPVAPRVEPVAPRIVATAPVAPPAPPAAPAARMAAPTAAPASQPAAAATPLDQLFSRMERAAKPGASAPSVFAPAAPPPLKNAPSQARLPPLPTAPVAPKLTREPPPEAAEGPVTIEPRPRQWQELETEPERLFARVGGR